MGIHLKKLSLIVSQSLGVRPDLVLVIVEPCLIPLPLFLPSQILKCLRSAHFFTFDFLLFLLLPRLRPTLGFGLLVGRVLLGIDGRLDRPKAWWSASRLLLRGCLGLASVQLDRVLRQPGPGLLGLVLGRSLGLRTGSASLGPGLICGQAGGLDCRRPDLGLSSGGWGFSSLLWLLLINHCHKRFPLLLLLSLPWLELN